jgi:hypothetical protein
MFYLRNGFSKLEGTARNFRLGPFDINGGQHCGHVG